MRKVQGMPCVVRLASEAPASQGLHASKAKAEPLPYVCGSDMVVFLCPLVLCVEEGALARQPFFLVSTKTQEREVSVSAFIVDVCVLSNSSRLFVVHGGGGVCPDGAWSLRLAASHPVLLRRLQYMCGVWPLSPRGMFVHPIRVCSGACVHR